MIGQIIGDIILGAMGLVIISIALGPLLTGMMTRKQRSTPPQTEIVDMPGEAPPVVVYGRPQHTPEEKAAKLHADWGKIGDAEAIAALEESLRGVPL